MIRKTASECLREWNETESGNQRREIEVEQRKILQDFSQMVTEECEEFENLDESKLIVNFRNVALGNPAEAIRKVLQDEELQLIIVEDYGISVLESLLQLARDFENMQYSAQFA